VALEALSNNESFLAIDAWAQLTDEPDIHSAVLIRCTPPRLLQAVCRTSNTFISPVTAVISPANAPKTATTVVGEVQPPGPAGVQLEGGAAVALGAGWAVGLSVGVPTPLGNVSTPLGNSVSVGVGGTV
jgi:hypothetical protein